MHGGVFFCLALRNLCDISLVCTSQIIPQSQYQLCHLPRVMFQVYAESCFLLSDIIFKPEVDRAEGLKMRLIESLWKTL